MALIEPNSRVDFLRGVPFDPTYENTMYFDNVQQQVSYFDTKMINLSYERLTYQRVHSGYMKVGVPVDSVGLSIINEMYNVNYMRFKNTNFENKWFYAFVDDVVYINNNTVGVFYHLDVLQTWHFDYSFNQCFIERQHTVSDRIGLNTIPENLETGDYVFDQPQEFEYKPVVIVVTGGLIDGSYAPGTVVQGLNSMGNSFSGLHHYAFDISTTQGLNDLNDMLEQAYTSRNNQNTIVAIFMAPLYFQQGNKVPIEKTVYLPTVGGEYYIDAHPVRNKKLLTYPYNFIYVSNYQGNHAEYKYEYFDNPAICKLKIWGSAGINCGMILYPNNYKTIGDNFDEMITLTGFPMCAWVNDAYKAWVAQNTGLITAGILGAGASWIKTGILGVGYGKAFSTANDAFGGHMEGTVAPAGVKYGYYTLPNLKRQEQISGAMENLNKAGESFGQSLGHSLMATAGILAMLRDHAVQPPQTHGNENANVLYQAGKMTFMIVNKHIKTEYAEIIDDFFDMYGYAIHKRGIPNRNARPCYTYVKTTDCSLDGNVPVVDLKAIEAIFNNGVRFWRTNATFGVYDVAVNNNAPIN